MPLLPARRLLARGALVAVLLAADLASKALVFGWLEPLARRGALETHLCRLGQHARQPLWGEWLAFSLSRNPGAAFGGLAGAPHLLVFGRIGAAAVLAWLLARRSRLVPSQVAALCLVLAGALGNLHDNLFLDVPGDGHPHGLVRDFIDLYFRGLDWHFETFNVADACISVGAALLLLHGLFGRHVAPAAAATT